MLLALASGVVGGVARGKSPAPPNLLAPPVPAAGVAPVVDVTRFDLHLISVSPGEFLIGSPDDEAGRTVREGPQTRVTISRRFYLGATDVTQALYTAVMGKNPSTFPESGLDAPVENVSWTEAMAFCARLTELWRATGRLPVGSAFTLPTEAQWEYACRAGTTGPNAGKLDDMAWWLHFSGRKTHPVATKAPNDWGFYDMNGNVWQWCRDWYADYPGGALTDPTGPANGTKRIARGGSWINGVAVCRSAYRNEFLPDRHSHNIGFRVALCEVPFAPFANEPERLEPFRQ